MSKILIRRHFEESETEQKQSAAQNAVKNKMCAKKKIMAAAECIQSEKKL